MSPANTPDNGEAPLLTAVWLVASVAVVVVPLVDDAVCSALAISRARRWTSASRAEVAVVVEDDAAAVPLVPLALVEAPAASKLLKRSLISELTSVCKVESAVVEPPDAELDA